MYLLKSSTSILLEYEMKHKRIYRLVVFSLLLLLFILLRTEDKTQALTVSKHATFTILVLQWKDYPCTVFMCARNISDIIIIAFFLLSTVLPLSL